MVVIGSVVSVTVHGPQNVRDEAVVVPMFGQHFGLKLCGVRSGWRVRHGRRE